MMIFLRPTTFTVRRIVLAGPLLAPTTPLRLMAPFEHRVNPANPATVGLDENVHDFALRTLRTILTVPPPAPIVLGYTDPETVSDVEGGPLFTGDGPFSVLSFD
jgi:hypothetical protein